MTLGEARIVDRLLNSSLHGEEVVVDAEIKALEAANRTVLGELIKPDILLFLIFASGLNFHAST